MRRRYSWLLRQLEETIVPAEDPDVQEAEALADDDVDELLVEEISIDGMCGVY
jgi:mycofactocin precursor